MPDQLVQDCRKLRVEMLETIELLKNIISIVETKIKILELIEQQGIPEKVDKMKNQATTSFTCLQLDLEKEFQPARAEGHKHMRSVCAYNNLRVYMEVLEKQGWLEDPTAFGNNNTLIQLTNDSCVILDPSDIYLVLCTNYLTERALTFGYFTVRNVVRQHSTSLLYYRNCVLYIPIPSKAAPHNFLKWLVEQSPTSGKDNALFDFITRTNLCNSVPNHKISFCDLLRKGELSAMVIWKLLGPKTKGKTLLQQDRRLDLTL